MKKELRPFADDNPQFTHVVVYVDPSGVQPWKFDGYKNYCAAQAETADFAIDGVDCVMVNLVTL